MFFLNTSIDLNMGGFVLEVVKSIVEIAIVFLGAYLTARFGYIFWLKRHRKELSAQYKSEYLSSLGEFLSLTQIEINLRSNKKISAIEIANVSLKRAGVEYKIDMARIKMRLAKVDDYIGEIGEIHKIDEMFKKNFVDLTYQYNKKNNKWCTVWKAFTKSLISKDEIEKEIDDIREYLKQKF